MIKLILAIIIIFILVSQPFLILVVGTGYVVWKYCCKEAEKDKKEEDFEPEGENIDPGDRGFTTTEERVEKAKANVEKDMETSPEFEAEQENIRDEIKQNAEAALKEEKLRLLKEAEACALKQEWDKVADIERKIAELGSK
jgi:hypothetical protein